MPCLIPNSRTEPLRPDNTEISSEDRAILAIAGFVCFISLLYGHSKQLNCLTIESHCAYDAWPLSRAPQGGQIARRRSQTGSLRRSTSLRRAQQRRVSGGPRRVR